MSLDQLPGVNGELGVELRAAIELARAAGVEVLGRTAHHILRSIYFFDPNGLRLELTVPTVPPAEMERLATRAHADRAAWSTR